MELTKDDIKVNGNTPLLTVHIKTDSKHAEMKDED